MSCLHHSKNVFCSILSFITRDRNRTTFRSTATALGDVCNRRNNSYLVPVARIFSGSQIFSDVVLLIQNFLYILQHDLNQMPDLFLPVPYPGSDVPEVLQCLSLD